MFYSPQDVPEMMYDGLPEDHYYFPDPITPASSARLTSSSMGTIPDFPTPAMAAHEPSPPMPGMPVIPPRRSVNLGPPPSSRRGQSSFYSSAFFVSPIPEESPRSRSHGSYASSAAIPETWVASSDTTASPNGQDAFYDDTFLDRNKDDEYDEIGDESRLVRSASLGKKGKPALIDTSQPRAAKAAERPAPRPVQQFAEGTAYVENSSSSSNSLPVMKPAAAATTANTIASPEGSAMGNVSMPDHSDQLESSRTIPPTSRPFNRLSAIRRPPKLDIDAVRNAEARGSLTSLPDLIRRATRLAAMIDGGKRPASRFEDLSEYLNEKGARETTRDVSDDRHQSGLSDMLAAFPPPAQTDRPSRASWFRAPSWPLPPGGGDGGRFEEPDSRMEQSPPKRRRRCCGIPMWALIVLAIFVLCVIIVAVVVPLQFFVLNNNEGGDAEPSLQQCEETVACLNGAMNVVSQGLCSCICTNGFTGTNCDAQSTPSCTMTDLVSSDGSVTINNVTLGQAIPRLVAEANTNFTIPLSGTAILAKFSLSDLSCDAQNSLVTFAGRSSRSGEALAEIDSLDSDPAALEAESFETVSAITITLGLPSTTGTGVVILPSDGPSTEELLMDTTSTTTRATRTTTTIRTTSTTSQAPQPIPTDAPLPAFAFRMTQQVLDFARVAVLFVLQEESAQTAAGAQADLEQFFIRVSDNMDQGSNFVTKDEARTVWIGGDNIINLVDFTVDLNAPPQRRSES